MVHAIGKHSDYRYAHWLCRLDDQQIKGTEGIVLTSQNIDRKGSVMTYKTLFFDADNTLFDFDHSECEAFRKLCVHYDFNVEMNTFFATYQKYNGQLWKALEQGTVDKKIIPAERFRLLLNHFGIKGDPEELGATYLHFLGGESHLIDGALELIQALADRFKLVIVTNGIESVQSSRLGASPLKDYFSEVIISEAVGVAKPDLAFFDYALEKACIKDKSEVLVIGDSLSSDILGGMNSGLDTCWYNPHKRPLDQRYSPTYIVGDFDDIKEILTKNV